MRGAVWPCRAAAFSCMPLPSKHFGDHATAYAALAGVLVFLLGALGTLLIVVRMQMGELQAVQSHTIAQLESVARDTNVMLERLNREYAPDCAPENLARLRGVLFGTRFQRDIGIFDGENRLLCTTSLGLLRTPARIQPPQVHALERGVTRALWFDLRVAVGGGKHSAFVVQQGPYNTVIDPRITADIFGSGASQVIFRKSTGELVPVRVNGEPPAALRERLRALAVAANAVRELDWRLRSFVFSAPVPGTRFIVQTHRSLQSALAAHLEVVLFLMALALLLGSLCFGAAAPRLRRLARLEYRIASLMQPEHVLCVYQPIVDLRNGAVVGCEVLMRLRDGAQVIYPDAAIAAVMRQGLTWQLDQAVIGKGLDELAQHLPPLSAFKVSFNLFPQNIRFDAVHALIDARMRASGRNDLQIDLEVIEQNYDASMIAEVGRFKAAGYLVSVDDFGTGFSNLGSVKKLSPSFLKIDKSFVFDMEDASVRSSLIPEIVGIARAVGAQVVAEGVENALQAERLRAHGVQFAQGYHFSRPVPIAEFAAFLRSAPGAVVQRRA
jgi:sensor c-di-GMP phosphodiesterase-like protein